MMRALVTVFASTILLGGVARAAALAPVEPRRDAEAPSEHAQPQTPRAWYGWQILAADAVTAGLWVGGARTPSPGPFVVLGAVTYLAASPVIHAQHHTRTAPILLARLLAPLVGLAAAAYVEVEVCGAAPGDGGYFLTDCQQRGAAAALAVPLLAVSIVDIASAWAPATTTAPTPKTTTARKESDFAWAPIATPTSVGAGATLGIVGRF